MSNRILRRSGHRQKRLLRFAPSSRGFTQIELLVALSVIGVLAAIIIPAVQAVRETSRRTQCQSNLRSFSAAIAGYEGMHQKLPESGGPPIGPSFRQAHPHSPHVALLPHLEQHSLATRIDTTHSPDIPSNSPGEVADHLRSIMPAFLCPSDGVDLGTNYRVCTGPDFRGWHVPDDPLGGPFRIVQAVPLAEIRDGLSQTAAMSERVKSDLDPLVYSHPQDYWYSGAIDVFGLDVTADELVVICQSGGAAPPEFDPYVGHMWHLASFGSTWYNHVITPNSRLVDCSFHGYGGRALLGSNSGVHKASSRHNGGVNVLYLDGSVRFVSDSVDLMVWRSMASIVGDSLPSGAF